MLLHKTSKFTRRLLLAGALVGTFGLATAAHAGKKDGKHGGGKKIERVCQEISCTGTQQEQLQAAFRDFHQSIKPEREKMKEAHKALKAEWLKDAPNEREMERLEKRVHAIQGNLMDRKHDLAMEVHAILKPEQRQKASKLVGKLLGGKGGHGKGHGGKKGKGKGKGKSK